MAYNKDEIYKEAVALSETSGYYFIQDIIDSLACGKTTFYVYFQEDSDELNLLKVNLYKNRIDQKLLLRKRLSEGNGTELIAMYKLIGNDEERKALSTNWQDITSKGEKIELKQVFQIGDQKIEF